MMLESVWLLVTNISVPFVTVAFPDLSLCWLFTCKTEVDDGGDTSSFSSTITSLLLRQLEAKSRSHMLTLSPFFSKINIQSLRLSVKPITSVMKKKVGNLAEVLDQYSLEGHNQPEPIMKPTSGDEMVDYTLNNPPSPPLISSNFGGSNMLSFADVMQFADFGPKLALINQANTCENDQETGLIDPVLNDNKCLHDDHTLITAQYGALGGNNDQEILYKEFSSEEEIIRMEENNIFMSMQTTTNIGKRSMGDQASIIGGAIEFVRELEQLLQCLESQKRRRLYGDGDNRPIGDPTLIMQQPDQSGPSIFAIPNDQLKLVEYETGGPPEETAEVKSCLADVEVKLLGVDGLIKILSRRRPGQLIETIAALEDLQLNIIHTNVTTIEQTVLYSFNVKISGEARFTAEDIANSTQQILSFIHANSSIPLNNMY
ncbi:hypothetical protein DH2020_019705 [Rehmannia glutinosa]|uniref:ACT domain-containing protein n=1 Tax=Rehmannia glutinosa TaxID=99300 RepID=A0ABR0WDZ5_REHGL